MAGEACCAPAPSDASPARLVRSEEDAGHPVARTPARRTSRPRCPGWPASCSSPPGTSPPSTRTTRGPPSP
eukprot:1755436-Lingulodinium_polyedra.AAC.1